jgi:hypothetical protein
METAVRREGGWCEMAASLGESMELAGELLNCRGLIVGNRRCAKLVAEAGGSFANPGKGNDCCWKPLPEDW